MHPCRRGDANEVVMVLLYLFSLIMQIIMHLQATFCPFLYVSGV